MTSTSGDPAEPLVKLLTDQPELLADALHRHRDDGAGRCPACPGPDGGRAEYPCGVRVAAEQADEIRRRPVNGAVG